MKQETKTFTLETLLTVTTGRLLTDIGDLYKILGWMTNDEPFTHQLPRFAEECKTWLYHWWPELGIAEASLVKLDKWLSVDNTNGPEAIKMWKAELKMMQPELKNEYEVPQIHVGDHKRKNPADELVDMVGPDKVIKIEI